MAGNRTLKLSILADVDDLRRKLNTADNEVEGFGTKLGNWSKVAGAAFLAAGAAAAAYAGKLAIDGVKAAVEDEAAQLKLATTLKNVTGATNAQIKATENYILKTSLAYGVTDEELRPSLDRLTRSTKSVEEAQKLQTIALNIAAGTGKDLTAVSEALAKAHDGNFGSLKRLGVSLDESIIKSKDFDAATKVLASTFKDQASIQADTFDGKMRRLKVAFDEGKESIGGMILDVLQPMVDLIVKKVIPLITQFTNSIGGAGGLKSVFDDYISAAKSIFIPVFEGIKDAFDRIKDAVMRNKEEFGALFNFLKNFVAPFLGGALKIAIEVLGGALAVIIDTLGTFVGLIERAFNGLKRLIDLVRNNPLTNLFSNASYESGFIPPSPDLGPVSFSSTIPGLTYEQFLKTGNTVVNVSGAIDPESVARQINDILTQSAARGGGASNLGSLV